MSDGATVSSGRSALRAAFSAALTRVDAGRAVADALATPDPDFDADTGTFHVLALGKAAAGMAAAAQTGLGDRVARGLVVTKDGHAEGFAGWPVLEAAHPVPDARSAAAGRRALEFAAEVPAEDRLLVLLSGGTSALVATPLGGLQLDDLTRTNRLLLASGAPIEAMNTVRKRLARVSAGRLAAATPAHRIDVWIISDVVGDDPAAIASGPCHADDEGPARALEIVEGLDLGESLPERVRRLLEQAAASSEPDAPLPDDPCFGRVSTRIVSCNRDALEAAAASLRAAGAQVIGLGDRVTGEAADRGRQLVALARAMRERGDCAVPTALVAGGETTVKLGASPGQGGRNQELALAAALALESTGDRTALLAAGTDGTDGPTDAAGGLVDAASTQRMRDAGIDPNAALDGHDALPALEAAGDLLRTGPTGTNVMDLVLIWVDPESDSSPA